MTPRVDRSKQCDGKVRFPDRREARRARQRVGHRDAGGHMAVYLCPWCRGFHIGHAFRDPYLEDVAARRAAAVVLDVDLAAAEAAAVVLGVTVDEALELLDAGPSAPWSLVIDEEHHHTAAELEHLLEREERTDG